MKRPALMLSVIGLVLFQQATGQSARSLINEGNDRYDEKKFDEAEVQYRKAMEQEKGRVPGQFNLGNSLHKQGKFDQSVREFETAAISAVDKATKAQAYYNMGNSFLESQQYEQAVKSYVSSLKLNPNDHDAKYNLSYSLRKMSEQQQQQQQQGNQQNDQSRNGDQQKQDQNQDRQQQGLEPQQQPQTSEQNQQKPDEGVAPQVQGEQKRISKADAERILDVLKNEEKDVQRKLRAKVKARAKAERDW